MRRALTKSHIRPIQHANIVLFLRRPIRPAPYLDKGGKGGEEGLHGPDDEVQGYERVIFFFNLCQSGWDGNTGTRIKTCT